MIAVAALALLGLGGGVAPVQGPVVEGVVWSSGSDAPLAYARVQVVDENLADWTDERGSYRLEGLPRGEWRLQILHPGHDTLEMTVAVPGDRAVRLDITLNARPGPTVDALADFEPFRVDFTLPALENAADVTAMLGRLYPSELARQRIGGEAVLRLWLDERGRVVRSLVASSSGYPALDSIALTVSDSMRFRPARSREEGARVIVRIPVLFTVPAPQRGGDASREGSAGESGAW